MTADPAALRAGLADQLAEKGSLTDLAWRAAVETVPREVFLDAHLYRQTSNLLWEPVAREELGEEDWLRLAYSDKTLVTQIDGLGAADATAPQSGRPTSSATLPSLVVRMLELADVGPGDRVLEIGTGTGYSTALLCHRLGDKNVTSIEYDPRVAARAAAHLDAAGYAPNLVVGDGLQGHQEGAEYDAVIATCAVRTIPPSWLWQLSDAGSITVTVSGWLLASGLIRLAFTDDGSATGRFTGETVTYMLARPHERPPRPRFFQHPGATRATRVSPALLADWTGHFVAQLAAPSAEMMGSEDSVILLDTATGSQAWTEPDGDGWQVHQYGPLWLWDQIEEALILWQEAGAPPQSAFGLTVSPDLIQRVWFGAPDTGLSWQLPA